MGPRSILLVDDDFGNLALLEEYLSDDYLVITAMSGMEALQILNAKEFDIIISDQRMPQMSGVELLEHARKKYPDTIRIILSAYSDANAMLDAINRGHVYRFLLKPWEHADLSVAIRQGLAYRDTMRANRRLAARLRRKVKQLDDSQGQLVTITRERDQWESLSTIARGLMSDFKLHLKDVSVIMETLSGVDVPPEIALPVDAGVASLGQVVQSVNDLVEYIDVQDRGLEPTLCDLDEIAREAMATFHREPEFAACEIEFSLGTPPRCYADRAQMSKALVHLLRHAARLAGDGEVVTLTTTSQHGDPSISVSPCVELGSDDGDVDMGICRMIVAQNEGSISTDSGVGHKATATLSLPAAA